MSKVLILIDGFNFYHRLKEFQSKFNRCVKWINYKALMLNYFKSENDINNSYEFIYFSAIAEHRGQECVDRHKLYIEALKTQNIKITLGQFKEKHIKRCSCVERCSDCNSIQDKTMLTKHEEKNTDVNIAIALVEKALLKEYDICYILSSDSDFYTAIERAKTVHPDGKIVLVPPPLVKNSSRKKPYYIKAIKEISGSNPLFISWNTIKKSQFSDIITLPDGKYLRNPWL